MVTESMSGKAEQAVLRFGRRASDDTFRAFYQACDAGDLVTAAELLMVLEDRFISPPDEAFVQGEHRSALLQAQARLWSMRCRHFGDAEEAVVSQPALATQQPDTSRIINWVIAWLRGPLSRFAKATEFSIKR